MITRIKNHPRITALVLMLIVAIPLALSPIGVMPINPIGEERIIVMDGIFSYDIQYMQVTFEALGEDGRAIYSTFHIFDCLFALTYCLLMMALLKPLCKGKSKWIGIVFPIIPAVFDCAENVFIEIASSQYPLVSESVANAATFFSSLKWIAVFLWLAVFMILAVDKRMHSSKLT